MMNHAFYCFVALLALSAWAIVGHAATMIPVPNGDFEDWQAIGDGGVTNAGWASVPGGQTPASNVGRNDEMWTNPGSFGSGWTEINKQRTDGKYGLQQPSNAHHVKVEASEPFSLAAPFNGHFIGFANLTDGDGVGESLSQVQSGVLGQVQQGIYTLNVAFGARRQTMGSTSGVPNPADGTAGWNDYIGMIALLADGTSLGSESVTIIPSLVGFDATTSQTIVDLQLVVNIGAGNSNIGSDLAILIQTENAGTRNGVATTLSTFTQANFDNVRLTFVPEPSSAMLLLGGGIGLAGAARRRRRA